MFIGLCPCYWLFILYDWFSVILANLNFEFREYLTAPRSRILKMVLSSIRWDVLWTWTAPEPEGFQENTTIMTCFIFLRTMGKGFISLYRQLPTDLLWCLALSCLKSQHSLVSLWFKQQTGLQRRKGKTPKKHAAAAAVICFFHFCFSVCLITVIASHLKIEPSRTRRSKHTVGRRFCIMWLTPLLR